MIKTLLKVGFMLVIGILVYNRFFGTEEEKAQSKAVFGKFKEVGRSIGDLLKSEKTKFDAGKYDNALGNLRDALGEIKQKANVFGKKEEVEKLREQQTELETMLDHIKQLESSGQTSASSLKEKEEFVRKFQELYSDMDGVVRQMEQQPQ